MKKKLTLFVAMYAMLLAAFAPLVLAQQEDVPLPEEPAPTEPVPPTDLVPPSESAAPTDPVPPSEPTAPSELAPPGETSPTSTSTEAGPAVGCQELYQDSKTFCLVDKNGEITRPDGTKARVFVDPAGSVFMKDENGDLVHIGEGASFMVDENDNTTDSPDQDPLTDTPTDTSTDETSDTPDSTDEDTPPEGNHPEERETPPDKADQNTPPEDTPGSADKDTPTEGVQYDNARGGAPKDVGA